MQHSFQFGAVRSGGQGFIVDLALDPPIRRFQALPLLLRGQQGLAHILLHTAVQKLLHIGITLHGLHPGQFDGPAHGEQIPLLRRHPGPQFQNHIPDAVVVCKSIYPQLAGEIVEQQSLADTRLPDDLIGAGMAVALQGKHLQGGVDHSILFILFQVKKFPVHLYLPISFFERIF